MRRRAELAHRRLSGFMADPMILAFSCVDRPGTVARVTG